MLAVGMVRECRIRVKIVQGRAEKEYHKAEQDDDSKRNQGRLYRRKEEQRKTRLQESNNRSLASFVQSNVMSLMTCIQGNGC